MLWYLASFRERSGEVFLGCYIEGIHCAWVCFSPVHEKCSAGWWEGDRKETQKVLAAEKLKSCFVTPLDQPELL